MAYNDPQFEVAKLKLPPAITGTSTASATNGVGLTAQLFPTVRTTQVNKIRVLCTVVPAAGITGLVITVKAGTNTVGVATIGTNTAAGNYADAVLTASNTNVAADTVFTAVVAGTATSSGANIGTWLAAVDEVSLFT